MLWLTSWLADQLNWSTSIQYGKAQIQPRLQYFQAKFSNELSVSLSAFKAARLFVPAKLKELKPDITIVHIICFYRLYDGFTGAVHRYGHYLNWVVCNRNNYILL